MLLPEEREWLERLKNWGLVDSFRYLHPDVAARHQWSAWMGAVLAVPLAAIGFWPQLLEQLG